jgi:hypothetical protein
MARPARTTEAPIADRHATAPQWYPAARRSHPRHDVVWGPLPLERRGGATPLEFESLHYLAPADSPTDAPPGGNA